MKIIDILNKINNEEEVPEKIKFDNTVFELEENKKEYSFQHENGDCETLLYRVMTTHFIDILLEAEVEVIEENKEIEEKLNWEEITDSVGKPLWDNKKKIWRVLDSYYREGDSFKISFSDENNFERFENQELYFEEREEK